ncbi:uncharacterized protein LOC135236257 isoform X3 [Anguilla rostrata]|uniref:uncharacterized protein LOC135236257 isoform X3 n=1 Tax=Anguilla rostrata TaxID=7938 RepID=UPI0030D02504
MHVRCRTAAKLSFYKRETAFPRGLKMTSTYESEKHQSNQVAVSVLLIGDDDVVLKTSGLVWDTLPRFAEVRLVKLVPLSAVPFVDPRNFQLLFFHLSDSNTSAELEALRDLRERSCKHSDRAVCVLVVPEAGPDVPDSAADFMLTQPVTVETVEEVLRRCSFLSEQSQNDSPSASASSNTAVGQEPEPEAADHQAEPATPVQERSRAESVAGPSGPLPEGPSAELTSGDLQAFLHSKKEQQRRMQIRQCCERLRELLPFIRSRTDTASTLELTVKYMAYLRQRLPQDILDKVVKALEENGPERWYKPTKAPKKRRTTCPARNKTADVPIAVPTDASFADDFIAAHVLGRHIQPKVEGIQPVGPLPPGMLMSQPFDPPPGLTLVPGLTSGPGLTSAPGPSSASGSSVALGQASGPYGQASGPYGQASGPYGQAFVMNQAYGEPAAPGPGYGPPVFWKQACGPVSSGVVNQNFVPQTVHNPGHPFLRGSSLPPVQTLMVGPGFLPRVGPDPGYPPPPPRHVMMNQTFAPLGSLNDPRPPGVTTNLPPACAAASGGVSDYGPITTAGSWEDRLLTEILYDSAPSQPSLSSSHSAIRGDNLPQSSAPVHPFSSSLSRPPQWDFGCGSGPVYPLQPYFLESLPPPSIIHPIPAQNATGPGSIYPFLGDVGTNKLYGQHYTGPTDYQINLNWGNGSS